MSMLTRQSPARSVGEPIAGVVYGRDDVFPRSGHYEVAATETCTEQASFGHAASRSVFITQVDINAPDLRCET